MDKVRLDEILVFASGVRGVATQMQRGRIGCMLMGAEEQISAGDEVHGTGEIVEVPVGEALLGRVVDALGRPLDDGPKIEADDVYPVERPAPAMQWLAAYSACSIAEFYRDHGQDALVVFDDLSKQADAYRELSLLLRRPPGREAYPGDIFYIQSRLLERATNPTEDAGSFRPELVRLFPFDLERFIDESVQTGSLHHLEPLELLGELVSEFMTAELIRVTMESFLSENTVRLRSMQAARDNIDKELDGLRNQQRQLRKQEITSELLDIVSGYEALRDDERRDDG